MVFDIQYWTFQTLLGCLAHGALKELSHFPHAFREECPVLSARRESRCKSPGWAGIGIGRAALGRGDSPRPAPARGGWSRAGSVCGVGHLVTAAAAGNGSGTALTQRRGAEPASNMAEKHQLHLQGSVWCSSPCWEAAPNPISWSWALDMKSNGSRALIKILNSSCYNCTG